MFPDKKPLYNCKQQEVITVLTNAGMAMLALFLFPLSVVTLGENPCKGMTVADCEISEDNIINR